MTKIPAPAAVWGLPFAGFVPGKVTRLYTRGNFIPPLLKKHIDYGLRRVMPFAPFSGDQGGYLSPRVIVSSKIRRGGRPRGSSGEGRGGKRGGSGVVREEDGGRKTLPGVVPGLGPLPRVNDLGNRHGASVALPASPGRPGTWCTCTPMLRCGWVRCLSYRGSGPALQVQSQRQSASATETRRVRNIVISRACNIAIQPAGLAPYPIR